MEYENRIEEAIYYAEINRYEKSNQALFECLSLRPNDGLALYLIGNNYFYLNNYEEALEFSKKSLEQNYSAEINFKLMGAIYSEMHDYVKSEKCYLESLRINPKNSKVIASYGVLMLQTHHEKKAARLLEEAMVMDPNDPWVIHCWFLYYSANNKLNEQLITLQNYLLNSSDEKSKIIKIALYNENKKNYKEAFIKLKEAFLLDPTNQELLSYLKILEIEASPFYVPHHFIDKIGGPGVIWVAFMSLLLLFNALKLYKIVVSIGIFYLLLALYTWVSLPLVKIYYKRKHR